MGVAMVASDHAQPHDLLRDADIALERAKSAGKGEIKLFKPGMCVGLQGRMLIETQLRGAVNQDELVVVYQPVVDLESQEFVALEALVRWNHPTRGVLTADKFIPAVE